MNSIYLKQYMKKILFICLVMGLLAACNKNESYYDSHQVNHDSGHIVSEMWQRGPIEYTANYDDDGHFVSMSIRDKNLYITVNADNGQIISYSVESNGYYKTANIDEEGRLVNSSEGYEKETDPAETDEDNLNIDDLNNLFHR